MQDDTISKSYQEVRQQTEKLCAPLENEDYVIQSIEDVSPPKWHLAHTTWFFETFILIPYLASYRVFDASFHHLFNSYYHSVGQPYTRAWRGLLSRPTVANVYAYRHYVDQHILEHLESLLKAAPEQVKFLLMLGRHHEQQHQELLMMDIKYNFGINPNFPQYQSQPVTSEILSMGELEFTKCKGGKIYLGYEGKEFCFDNELPRHPVLLNPYEMANRLVTNGEYLEFIADGGYDQPKWWLADGWDAVQKNHWTAPLYWHRQNNHWQLFTLNGLQDLNPHEPVSHVSFYEADAYARWRGARLPTEMEWEHFAENHPHKLEQGNFLERGIYHPQGISENIKSPQQILGELWEWTASPYHAYPGYKPFAGALGEYNGKFMSNQMVLRGGCCVTPRSHIRTSYRNFFQPDKRWQFSGIRLVKNL